MAVFAAASESPKAFGTLQSLAAPAGPLVVKVSVAWPLPIVTVADPAAGVFEVMALVVPEPPAVGPRVIPVTTSPAGTVSDTVTLTPIGEKSRPVHVPTGTVRVVVPPADATVTSVKVNVPVAVRKPD